MENIFGKILREWRRQRRYSQLQLAVDLNVSSKHISFLETGRSLPSREMILKIGSFLFLPKREINRGLHVVGFSPAYAELSNDHADLKPIFSAIDQMLENHMPYPAIVLNQNWDVVNANDSAKSLLFELGFSDEVNLVEAFINDDQKTSKIINWRESALAVLTRLRYDISLMGGSEYLEGLEEQLSKQVMLDEDISDIDRDQIVVSTRLKLGGKELSFFSIIAQLGTVQDVKVSELKVELMFPSDETTKEYYQK